MILCKFIKDISASKNQIELGSIIFE